MERKRIIMLRKILIIKQNFLFFFIKFKKHFDQIAKFNMRSLNSIMICI